MPSAHQATPQAEPSPSYLPEGLSDELVAQMRSVGQCERKLSELNFTWGHIESTAKMTCPVEAKSILPAMAATRRGFETLERQLVDALVMENLRKIERDLAARAQMAIDVLIRNLFERTADVGFLATDDDIRQFMQSNNVGDGTARTAIYQRLCEYRAKYTVYDDILLVAPDGRVLAHADNAVTLEHSQDVLIAATLAADGYVETFRVSDLRPSAAEALLYSRRIDDPKTLKPIGVLVLSFRFADEMSRIFTTLGVGSSLGPVVLAVVDGGGRVIASSDADHIALRRKLPEPNEANGPLVELSGRDYIAISRAPRGYEGYFGPAWRVQAMLALDVAFRKKRAGTHAKLGGQSEAIDVASSAHYAAALAPELAKIATQADRINLSLRRVVWNGQVMASTGDNDLERLKPILGQISDAGERTARVFSSSINELYGTVLSAWLQDTKSAASLAIDIMDRNLYERANDCRWWALNAELACILRDGASVDGRQRANEILRHINSLYTVYTALVVYDSSGQIVAASALNADALSIVGERIGEDALRNVASLENSQQYWVSPFEPSAFYAGRRTYIYHAAIRDDERPQVVLGGIGIVFDSAPQLRAMLGAALPRVDGAYGVFIDSRGLVVAASDPTIDIGANFDLSALSDLTDGVAAGESRCGVRLLSDGQFIVGVARAGGYREFKTSDGYCNDLLALILVPINYVTPARPNRSLQLSDYIGASDSQQEIATFQIGDSVYGLAAAVIVEAVELQGFVPLRTDHLRHAGLLAYDHGDADSRHPAIVVVDARQMIGASVVGADVNVNVGQVIIVRTKDGLRGVIVDELLKVISVDRARIVPARGSLGAHAGLIEYVVRANENSAQQQQLLVLSATALLASVATEAVSQRA